MKVCPSCGSELAEELSFCPSDGSPLLSKEEELEKTQGSGIGEETIVMGDDKGDIGEATVVMGAEESEEIETEVPDRQPAGDATLVMAEPPFPEAGEPSDTEEYGAGEVPPPPADTMYAGSSEEASDTEDWQSEDTGAGWGEAAQETSASDSADEGWEEEPAADYDEPVEEEEEDHEDIAAAFAPAAEVPGGGPPPEKSKSKLGLILALLALFIFFIVILAGAGGFWWYLSRSSTDMTAANSNENADLSNANDESPGAGDDANLIEDTPMPEESPEASPEDTKASPSPSPSASRTPRTPTPTPTRTPERTETPRTTPTRTPVRTPTPVRTTPTPPIPSRVSRGVVNGQAVSLPKPAYPSAARAVNAKGTVTVAVVIDRNGNVVSASAVSGHPLLRSAAVTAARRARFRPTLVSGQPVEVSGTIVYNFN